MIKIVKKAHLLRLECGLTETVVTPLVEKTIHSPKTKVSCGLNIHICENGELRKVS
ncbi:hypothetical protein SAMN06313486_10155 [Epsilonproteobacteria bacterium SCGC AD-308-P11]|jgi:hypothetical protein|nr:hypothetical protein SAMN06313486_10155 [Epsilonproteobacteria bacterium SCGC AD-308-P11]